MDPLLWDRVGELADRSPRFSDLHHHRLHLIAASRMRARGETVPESMIFEERLAAAIALAAPMLMRRVREATDARIIVMKGPEAASRWPHPRLRPWQDLDLLVEDAHAVQGALLGAGFVEVGEPAAYVDIHHLRPLASPGLPLSIEVHMHPKWPTERAPGFAELHADAAPGAFASIPDVVAPSAAHHAVLLAAHAWEHDPLSRLGSLVDIAALMLEAGRDETDAVAHEWGVARLWTATARAIDEVLLDEGRSLRRPIWRRHLHEARERTVFETHVERLVGPVAAHPVAAAPAVATRALAKTLRPRSDERWGTKMRRSSRALRNRSLRRSDHLDREGPV
ncbi:nucleotidyltransferase family protein [Solirubrobacter soli]|uniref:nucleotidyltransferase family protein n=1 Tax=Solirubrobacter soli TaxID=363832 RepID=UPI00041C6AC8|nr:nucleotidyltransferase family protein [Solirubrobacter soli]